MDVQFLEPAQAEFLEAIEYYNSQGAGLGTNFSEEVQAAILRIIEYPEAWPLISKRTRRCRTRRFPYGIIYQVGGDSLLVVSVMHLHRDPKSWRTRIAKRRH